MKAPPLRLAKAEEGIDELTAAMLSRRKCRIRYNSFLSNAAKEQSIAENGDGSLVLEMSTSGRQDVLRWLMGFGDQAELLEPADLRDALKRTLASAAERYGA